MYKCKVSGLTVYETLDELLNANVTDMFEYNGNYYISVYPEEFYDESVWKVNKKTEDVSVIHYVETFSIPKEERIPIDPETLRRAR